MSNILNANDITILVNSCDKYSDTWYPFFTLLKKYWDIGDTKIILNTESLSYSFEGLNIIVSNFQTDKYGLRIIKAIKRIKTKFVLLMLDDFFLRATVDNNKINNIINYMKTNKNIIFFNFENLRTHKIINDNSFEGFERTPIGEKYTLCMQAGIWRTKGLLKYWKKDVTPWEWEMYTNYLTYFNKNDIFYHSNTNKPILDYGHYKVGDIFGIYKEKWVKEDVEKVFEKNNINLNLNKRGVYIANKKININHCNYEQRMSSRVYKWLGFKHLIKYLSIRILKRKEFDYFKYLDNKINDKEH